MPYVVLWPHFIADYYETSAESREDAKAKVKVLLDRRCTLETDWRWDGEPELVV